MPTQRGISAVKIIVVIVILVAVAAIAVPAWRQHEIIGRVDAALKAADAAKLVVTESATVRGELTRIKTSELGYNPAVTASPYVASMEIADGGRITITTKDTGATPDIVLLLTPSEDTANNSAALISWSCTVLVGDVALIPADCRKTASVSTAPPPAATATISSARSS